jgi:ABC-type transporter Mla MlaB component
MLQITEQRGSTHEVVYRLAGEITVDQIPRLEALVRTAHDSGHEVTLDVSGVWRVDRPTSGLIARLASSPGPRVRLEGVHHGLLAWLRGVSVGRVVGPPPDGKERTR